MKPRAFSNDAFHIRRSAILYSLRLPQRIPLGFEAEYHDVIVVTGHWDDAWGPRPAHHLPKATTILPHVRVVAKGVANRIQVTCPACGRWMRFCALQQHVGSKVCNARACKSVSV